MPDPVLFSVELVSQTAQTGLAPGDPLSPGALRIVIAGVEVWNDAANLTSSALCLLRTTRGGFVGPIEGVSDTNPLIHHCGLLPEMGCPIGASWRVVHVGDEVHIDRVVRARDIGRDEALAVPAPALISRELYADQIRAFALAVRAGLDAEPGRYSSAPDPGLAPVFDAFWAEYDALLAARDLIATALTAESICEHLEQSMSPVVEAAPGMYLIDVCDDDESAQLVQRAERSTWSSATINADRRVDASVRDADVLDAPADAAFVEACRAQLFAATRALAAELAPGSVLAEVQIVRYHPGGHYADHRDTPAIGATPRVLSVVWYLNANFTGGETVFSNPDVIVSPVSGVAIAFSPVLMHRAEPVASGTKYAVTAWYHHVPRATP